MNRRIYRRAFLCILLIGFAPEARAETLDDASIRALYAAKAAAVDDPEKLTDFMDDKLDDFYTLKSHLTQLIGNALPQNSVLTSDKTQAMDNVTRGYSIMQPDHHESKITEIHYSDDHQYAYVTTVTASSGTMTMADPQGGYRAAHYEDGEGCVDQLGLVRIKLKILQSACNEKFVVK